MYAVNVRSKLDIAGYLLYVTQANPDARVKKG